VYEVQDEGNIAVYCDVFMWYMEREIMLCRVMCVRGIG